MTEVFTADGWTEEVALFHWLQSARRVGINVEVRYPDGRRVRAVFNSTGEISYEEVT